MNKKTFLSTALFIFLLLNSLPCFANSFLWKDENGKIHMSTNKPNWWNDCCLVLVNPKKNIVDEVKTKNNIENYKAGKDYIKTQIADNSDKFSFSIANEDGTDDDSKSAVDKTDNKTDFSHTDISSEELKTKIEVLSKGRAPTPTKTPAKEKTKVGTPTKREYEIYHASEKDLFIDHPKDSTEKSNKRIAKKFHISVDDLLKIQVKVKTYEFNKSQNK